VTIRDEDQVRAWCVDYALRLGTPKGRLRPGRVIADAQEIERYITARPPCELKLIAPRKKKDTRP
jgi:hypothetical protein